MLQGNKVLSYSKMKRNDCINFVNYMLRLLPYAKCIDSAEFSTHVFPPHNVSEYEGCVATGGWCGFRT